MALDYFLQHWINGVATSSFLDHVMAAITNFSAWRPILILAVIVALLMGDFRMRAMLLCLAIALGLTDGVVVNSIKHIVGRPRPFQAEAGVRLVHLAPASPQLLTMFSTPKVKFSEEPLSGVVVQGRSFPSSHSSNIMVAATVLFLFYRRWWWIYFFIAALVCYSRIYTGAHWPSDVLVASFLGILMGVVVVRLADQAWKKWGVSLAPALAARHPSLYLKD